MTTRPRNNTIPRITIETMDICIDGFHRYLAIMVFKEPVAMIVTARMIMRPGISAPRIAFKPQNDRKVATNSNSRP